MAAKLPTNIHLLQGNRSKLSKAELKAAIVPVTEIPQPPKFLDELALKEWERITPLLESLGCISQIDVAALAGYCQLYSTWEQLQTHINREGITALVDETSTGMACVSVYHRLIRETYAQMLRYLVEFGLTPVSRSRITAKAGKEAEPKTTERFFK